MGKKKKGGNKLGKMSEEERMRYLQARADVEEEARRRKQQLIALYMKNKLKREDAFTRLNLAKINQEWRSILRQLKCEELRNDIVKSAELCKLSLARKDQIIQRLLSDLEESEEMFSKNLQSHSHIMGKLSAIHELRLRFWYDFYSREKSILLEQFYEDIALDKQSFEKSKCDLECFYFDIEQEIRRDDSKSTEQAQMRLDGFRNLMTIRLDDVTKTGQMESLWREFQIVLNSYTAYTKEFYDDYCKIRRQDEIETRINQNHYHELAKCTEIISNYRLEINSQTSNIKLTTEHLQEVKSKLQMHYMQLKTKHTQERLLDKKNIQTLVCYANNSRKVLEKLHRKGTNVEQLAGICRKYESDGLKFSLPMRSMATLLTFPNDFNMVTYMNLSKMDRFWDRYNKIRLDCACLVEERSCLLMENQRLKMKIKQYLVDLTMRNPSGNKAAHLAQRPKSMTIEKVECIELSRIKSTNRSQSGNNYRPVTCIEGNLSVAIRSQKLLALNNKIH